MRGAAVVFAAIVLVASSGAVARAEGQPSSQTQVAPKSRPLRITFYPLLVRVPIFGASVDVPEIPGGGGGESGDQSGSTDYSFNAAYMAGLSIEGPRWFGEVNGLWAALSASHSTPFTTVDSDVYFFTARGGIRLFRNLSGTVGVRRVSVGLDVQVTPTATSSRAPLRGSTKPGVWDPLVGLDWRASLGRSWSFDAVFQGGGFGVGTDVDVEGDLYADWHAARHFDVRLGYTSIFYKLTIDDVQIGSFERTLVTKQTLHGPTIGFGIVF